LLETQQTSRSLAWMIIIIRDKKAGKRKKEGERKRKEEGERGKKGREQT